jgi:uncharacterized protein (DUF697 family)
MDTSIKCVVEEMEGSHCGTSSAEAVAEVADRAHPGSGGATAAVSAESSVAVMGPPVRRNRSGAEKKGVRRTLMVGP